MPLFELINPSDPFTFEAPDLLHAGVAVVLISGNYGATALDGPEQGESTPILFGWNNWLSERGVSQAWVAERRTEIADILDTFLIGTASARRDIVEAMKLMSPEDREKFKAERTERQRTSMNHIGRNVAALSTSLRHLAANQVVTA